MLFNLIRSIRLKNSIMDIMSQNKELLDALAEYEKEETQTNLAWEENGLWYGWYYDPEKKRYYFDDIGHESLTDLWEYQFSRKDK